MRVALVTHRYAPHLGGIERYLEELAAGLARRGIDVDVLTPERDGSLPPVARAGHLTVRRYREPAALPRYAVSPALARRLWRGLGDYDVVHAHNYHELLPLAAAYGRAPRLAVTPFYHPPVGGPGARAARVPHRLLAAPAVRRADRVVCISHAEADALAEEVGGIAGRLTVIPAGVDVQAIGAAAPMPALRPVVLSVGRLVGYKRVDRIVEAMARSGAGAELVVAGAGPEEDALRERAARAGVDARFVGRVSDADLHRWLRTATVVVTMSERESFGLTVAEALAAGARVVASDIPPHRETAALGGEGRSAFVAADAGPAALAGAIDAALAAGRPAAPPAEIVSWDAMAGRVADLYAAMVAEPAGPRRGPAPRLARLRDIARAHAYVIGAASGPAERLRVARFVARQVARRAGLGAGGDTAIAFRGTTYVVGQSAELHTLVELYRDELYSRVADFAPRAGTTVVDVGANVGVFTLLHARAGARVLALEPNPAALARLTKAVAANGLAGSVTGRNAAAGAMPGWGRLHLEGGLSVLGTVRRDPGPAPGGVEIVTLDAAVAGAGLGAVDLLKVDVEGAEADVLRGGPATLARTHRLILEYHSHELLAEVRALLADAGFREVTAFAASGAGAGMLYAERA